MVMFIKNIKKELRELYQKFIENYKSMKYVSLILIIFSTSVITGQSEKNDEVIARIGNKTITAQEFKERFELTPRIKGKGRKSTEAAKEDLLYSIIAEKLWALEAENNGLDTTDIMQYTFPALEKMYIRDALHKTKVRDKIKIEPDAFMEGRRRSSYNVLTKFFHSNNEVEIDSLLIVLNSGASFDSLFFSRPQDAGNMYEVEYGKMEEFVEDSIYSTDIGSYTSKIKSPEGWYIFKIDTIKQNMFNTESAINSRDMNIRKTVEARALMDIHSKFYNDFFKGKTVNTDGELFWRFSDLVIEAIIKNAEELNGDNAERGKIVLSEFDFNNIQTTLGEDTLSMIFVKFPENPVTLKEFMHDFFFEGFYTTTTNPDIIRSQLNARVRYFIEHEYLTRAAVEEGLNQKDDVEFYRSMWRDNYLGTMYKKRLLNSIKVSDEEAFELYNKNNETNSYPKKVNIIEILTDSLEVIEQVLNQLDNGADIRELAKKHTKRNWTRERGGEFGPFPSTRHGEIGRIAGEMEVGEIYGPLKTEEGYSVFKLIEKIENENEMPGSFGEIKNELKKRIGLKKLKNTFTDKTADLASKYGININTKVLDSVKVTDLTMVVYRYMGFGGRILAVPFTNTFTDWVEKWKSNKQSLP